MSPHLEIAGRPADADQHESDEPLQRTLDRLPRRDRLAFLVGLEVLSQEFNAFHARQQSELFAA